MLLDTAKRLFAERTFTRREMVTATARTGRALGYWLADRNPDPSAAIGKAFDRLAQNGAFLQNNPNRWRLRRSYTQPSLGSSSIGERVGGRDIRERPRRQAVAAVLEILKRDDPREIAGESLRYQR